MKEFIPPPAPRPTVTHANCMVSELEGFRPLLLDLHVPAHGDGPFPVLLWIHGGAWAWGSRTGLPPTVDAPAFYETFLSRGYAVADIDYRLSSEAPYPAPLMDIQAAIEWLRHFAAQLNIDPLRFAALGESAGAHLANMAALSGEGDTAIQAVISWYGPASFDVIDQDDPHHVIARLFGGALRERQELVREGSPLYQVHPAAPPFLLIHGTADDTVRHIESLKLADALKAQGVRAEVMLVDGAGHCFEGHDDINGLVKAGVDFLDTVLR
ncbi:alpha/beta hydrolase [Catelliglobosispora koreensis]|uniref:alpha/beta hydrolase n=1 Tax=Catelliglobosispora koreensis TaxID=129052 RepID=UPI00036B593C|nr:alpha/beta hydrolase [Catelliglobosispora koreensis]